MVVKETEIGYLEDEPVIEREIFEFAVVENNAIVNVTLAAEALGDNWILKPEGVGIGWIRAKHGGAWSAPDAKPVTPPEQVLRWQAVRALRLHADPHEPVQTCLQTVQQLRDQLAATEGGADLAADIDDALNNVLAWRRDSPMLLMMASAASWSSEFVDELFTAANSYDL